MGKTEVALFARRLGRSRHERGSPPIHPDEDSLPRNVLGAMVPWHEGGAIHEPAGRGTARSWLVSRLSGVGE